jgi:hypothetical protein
MSAGVTAVRAGNRPGETPQAHTLSRLTGVQLGEERERRTLAETSGPSRRGRRLPPSAPRELLKGVLPGVHGERC